MTDAVYYTDPYAQSLDARISDIGPDYVVLDRTIFYPTGGGQPGDTGVIGLSLIHISEPTRPY